MANLTPREVEMAEFAFSIFADGVNDAGVNTIDCFSLGHILRALSLNLTNAAIERLGGTKKRGEKALTLEEFLPVYNEAKSDKDQGCFEDFIECLKLYDKQENGTMLLADLTNTLKTLGEKLDDMQVDIVMAECMEPEDEDGFIQYTPFLKKLCDRTE